MVECLGEQRDDLVGGVEACAPTLARRRGSMVDDGLTLGTNRRAGVCVHFYEPVPSLLRRKGHSAITVTVADLDRLVDRLQG